MIQVSVRARKGAMAAAFRRAADQAAASAEQDPARDAKAAILIRAREAVSRYLQAAPAGSQVNVQATVDQDPRGGWSATLLVSVDLARDAGGRRA